ncbi:hypothetical protein K523DRAFT_21165 [Schizophyllum commune Tattone D]|nr:hypothetical protein K523DRAFT_21165 [Schizophyllum commune Tattone D]
MREGWGTPYPSRCACASPGEWRDSSLRRRELVARPSTRMRRPARTLRVLTREGEGVHVRIGCDAARTTRYSALHANAPAFKIPETDMFDAKDPSPSSLPTSSCSTPSSQLSTTPLDASRCDSRDVANG